VFRSKKNKEENRNGRERLHERWFKTTAATVFEIREWWPHVENVHNKERKTPTMPLFAGY